MVPIDGQAVQASIKRSTGPPRDSQHDLCGGVSGVAEQPKNERDTPGLDCEAILDDDPRATDGLYWIDLDGEGEILLSLPSVTWKMVGGRSSTGITITVRTRPLGDWITIRPSIAGRTF